MTTPEQQLFLLSTLLQLEKHARHAETLAELGFVMVNETLRLIKYRQAVLWIIEPDRKIHIQAISGADKPDAYSPFIVWLEKLLQHLYAQSDNNLIHTIIPDALKDEFQSGWQEWNMGISIWCPLISPDNELQGGLLLIRSQTHWDKGEIVLLEHLTDTYAHAWQSLKQRKISLTNHLFSGWRKRGLQLLLFAIIIGLMFLPVRLSVLAPVEIVPFAPFIVSAPMDGVIHDIYVNPGQQVKADQVLFHLDDTGIRNEYEISKKALSVVQAEYERATRKALTGDERSRADIAILKARIEQKSAEVDYMADVLDRIRVHAAQSGIVIFKDVNDWLGRPVSVGEKIMTIANPEHVEADIRLSVEDAINLEPGADIRIFLNVRPDHPLLARLHQASYEAQVTPEGILAFQLKALFIKNTDIPRIGLRGTAKIYGKKVTLFYYLMRRPMTALRQRLGM